MSNFTRGFQGRRFQSASKRLPPGQHVTREFPVLSAGPTPHTRLDTWTFALEAEDGAKIASWSWEEFRALGPKDVTVDIHCVTRWSKFDTDWCGISVDRIAVSDWPGHLPGQHADVRLTAEDGYRAERSFSIASPPEVSGLELTVDRLDDGEVSPFLTDQLQPDDTIQLRGPIGGSFVWSPSERGNPLLLVGGGSGVVPLMCMLRHRRLSGSAVPAALLYSSRTRDEVIYHEELAEIARSDPRFTLRITLTRDSAAGWSGAMGRIDLPAVQALLRDLSGVADSFVCGSDGFVEAATALLMQAGPTGPRDPHRAVWPNRNVAPRHVTRTLSPTWTPQFGRPEQGAALRWQERRDVKQ